MKINTQKMSKSKDIIMHIDTIPATKNLTVVYKKYFKLLIKVIIKSELKEHKPAAE